MLYVAGTIVFNTITQKHKIGVAVITGATDKYNAEEVALDHLLYDWPIWKGYCYHQVVIQSISDDIILKCAANIIESPI